ncbi:hypothetical protein B0H13DRAFT_2304311 [Mycena leptocephala]|nr:hypothetical protein B0H13DRAFT_2304311 [Mycena leptocephala]
MSYSVDSEDFDSSWRLMISLFSETAVSLLLYGIYLAFFLLAIYTLSRRRRVPGIKILMVLSCVMAALGTTQVAVIVAATVINAHFIQRVVSAQASNQPGVLLTLGRATSVTFAINGFAADSLFLYRCYVIWGFRWKILILPVVLMISTLVLGILWGAPVSHIGDVRIAYGLGAATNLLLTAGRILWIQRAAAHTSLDNTVNRRYNMAMTIILESGAIYCIGAIFLSITASRSEGDLMFRDLTSHYTVIGIGGQLVNIIPTFTLVYVGLKNTVDYDRTASRSIMTFNRHVPFPEDTHAVQLSELDFKEGGN